MAKIMAPIVFAARGQALDTRFWVFGTEYHLHSAILKQHSDFFFRFMDSPDKKLNLTGSGFKYEWKSKVDEDFDFKMRDTLDVLGWTMMAGVPDETESYDGPSKEHTHIPVTLVFRSNLPMEHLWELRGFHNFICAMYSRPYRILSKGDLGIITKIADYYCACPVVSNTLSGALASYGPVHLNFNILDVSFAEYACKLRHAALLHDYVVHFAGLLHHMKPTNLNTHWDGGRPDELDMEDKYEQKSKEGNDQRISEAFMKHSPQVQHLVEKSVQILARYTSSANEELYSYWKVSKDRTKNLVADHRDTFDTTGLYLPQFYQNVRREIIPKGIVYVVEFKATDRLLQWRLKFDSSLFSYKETGSKGVLGQAVKPEEIFLCAGFGHFDGENHLPWDITAVDW